MADEQRDRDAGDRVADIIISEMIALGESEKLTGLNVDPDWFATMLISRQRAKGKVHDCLGGERGLARLAERIRDHLQVEQLTRRGGVSR